eukprot:g8390.t1
MTSTGRRSANVALLLLVVFHTTMAFVATTSNRFCSRAAAACAAHTALPHGSVGVRAETSIAAAAGFFETLFGGLKAEKGNKSADTARLSEELFSLLSADDSKPDDDVVMKMIEELEAAPGVLFNKDYLYDGPWRVLWKKNTEWQRYFDPLNRMADNRAYQWYKEDGSVTNIAQALGEKLYITVDGQGTPASGSANLPYECDVEVSGAWLHVLGGKIPLNFIKGKGTTIVVYNDPRLRIFRSDTGGLVVQTKANEVVPV